MEYESLQKIKGASWKKYLLRSDLKEERGGFLSLIDTCLPRKQWRKRRNEFQVD